MNYLMILLNKISKLTVMIKQKKMMCQRIKLYVDVENNTIRKEQDHIISMSIINIMDKYRLDRPMTYKENRFYYNDWIFYLLKKIRS